MAAYLKLDGLDGESKDKGHEKWIKIESVSWGVHRSIHEGARDEQRQRGHTTAQDIVIVRQVDKTSPKLMEQTAIGKPIKEAEVHLCNMANDKQEPYMKMKLSNVIVSSYSCHANGEGSPLPHEEVTINFTKFENTYIPFDNDKSTPSGNVVGQFDLGKQST
jgi:type VI secretion system secreted protein Hcp